MEIVSKRSKNLLGQKFGRLLVKERLGCDKHGSSIWLCVCDCGGESRTRTGALTSGDAKSCGCIQREWAATARPGFKTGLSVKFPRAYRSWAAMRTRCLNAKNPAYKWYGGRGIKVCDRWSSFENFLADMGDRPHEKTLDRINNDGDYEPNNCRWATPKEQAKTNRGVLKHGTQVGAATRFKRGHTIGRRRAPEQATSA